MQGWRFDDLTRTLGHATNRRQVLKGLFGGLLGVGAASRVARQPAAAAGCGGSFAECRQEASDFYNQCRTNGGTWLDCVGTANDVFSTCIGSRCPDGQLCCGTDNGNQCIDITSDRNNCGNCGHQCPDPNQVCENEVCVCAEGFTSCYAAGSFIAQRICCPPDTYCKPFGDCSKPCDPPCGACQVCDDGTCRPDRTKNNQTCGSGRVCCHGDCADLQNDRAHCGGCWHTCPNGRECCGGQCVQSCPTGQQRDPTTCACTDGCVGKPDGTDCGNGDVCCGEACVDTQSDHDNCGDCGQVCSGSQQCTGGKCLCTPKNCPSGQTQDPVTCNCVDNTCHDQPYGTSCGDAKICCGGSCVDSPVVACDAKTENWDPDTCSCVDRCSSYCEPNGYICCTDASGGSYCCDQGMICCDNPLGCCVPG